MSKWNSRSYFPNENSVNFPIKIAQFKDVKFRTQVVNELSNNYTRGTLSSQSPEWVKDSRVSSLNKEKLPIEKEGEMMLLKSHVTRSLFFLPARIFNSSPRLMMIHLKFSFLPVEPVFLTRLWKNLEPLQGAILEMVTTRNLEKHLA
ncbi:MAG: hypothetical protein AAF443_07540 [Chlamydiota bacterium]